MTEPLSEHELLMQFLATREIPCPVCGYNLRACESEKCPECGAVIELRIGSLDLKLTAWIIALVAVCLPLGFSAFMGTVGAIEFIRGNLGRASDYLVWGYLWAMTLALSGFLWSLLRRRRNMWKQSRTRQWLIVCLYSSVAISLVTGFFIIAYFVS